MDKCALSERDICSKFITPALHQAGWDVMTQIREEWGLTNGRIIVRGKLVSRGQRKRADYVLYFKPNIPLAIIEAKDNAHSVGDGMQQALGYAATLDIPFAFLSNGDGFVFHDRTGASNPIETNLTLDEFPSPADLWSRYRAWKGLTPEAEQIMLEDYFDDGGGKTPRYYQVNAVKAAVEAIAKGQDRILLVMATGTGKTYTAFQIIWRLWKAEKKKRILFLADRNVLIDQTMVNDFHPFGAAPCAGGDADQPLRSPLDHRAAVPRHQGSALWHGTVGESMRRDRLLLVSAFAVALLTLLGAVGESLGMDRLLKSNTSKVRTYSLFRQGRMLYELIPNMSEHRLITLMEVFARVVSGGPEFSGLFAQAK